MKRIENVYHRLEELTKETGITTIELANDLGLARPNVSDDLNRLCDEGRAVKEGSKPVRYKAVVQTETKTVLDRFAERFPSLAQPVEQAKAAVLYPPNGMPMLILGETGTGKSLLANLIHDFAEQVGEKQVLPFFVFNCADYANNAQLLVSWLFGAKKGTYTGADTDREGVIEKADGGFLFLDEVHRLPPEGQEMLFSFLDRGTFRRLGDSDTERRATVRIIAATTENPDSALLRTFTRRIPMIIKLPALNERSIDERLELVQTFYSDEASRLGKPVYASVNSIRSLLGYHCTNNVGQLKTDIQLLCARAYSDFVSRKKESIQIITASLPEYIKEGLFSETAHREIWHQLTDVGNRFCTFSPDAKEERENNFGNRDSSSIYELIDLRLQEMKAGGLKEQEIDEHLDSCIKSYFSRFCNYQEQTESTIMNMADKDTALAISEIIPTAEKRLGRQFSSQIRAGIAMHVITAVKRIKSGQRIVNPDFNRIRQSNPDEFAAAVEALNTIDHTCEISMPLEEAGFLSFFFIPDTKNTADRTGYPVRVIVMAHGESTATSMARACNDLLRIHWAEGIDVPLNESPETAWTRLRTLLTDSRRPSDILLLVDMGSLTNLGKIVESELHLNCRTITMVSTLHVLQATRKAIEGLPLERVYQDVASMRDSFMNEPVNNPPVRTIRMKYVITLCTTGEGSALVIRDHLVSRLKFDRTNVLVRNFGISRETDIKERLRALLDTGQILFLVSPFHMDMGVPVFSIQDAMSTEGIIRMQEILDRENLFDKIENAYREFLSETTPEEVFPATRTCIEHIEKQSGLELKESVRIGMLCHIACMIDRLKKGAAVRAFNNRDAFIRGKKELYEIVRKTAEQIETQFSVAIPDDEICYLISFFHPENCIAAPAVVPS